MEKKDTGIAFDVDEHEPWAWHTFTQDRQSVKLELYQPTTAEMLRFQTQFGLGTRKPDWDGAMKHVARKWFRSFEGAKKRDGKAPIENTEANRLRMLDVKPALFDFVYDRLKNGVEEDDEGKVEGAAD